MSLVALIVTTRTVHFRGGRSIPKGVKLQATRVHDGWLIAHPSGIEGASAMVMPSQAREVRA